MPFVHRDDFGKIDGTFGCPQTTDPDSEEFLEEDNEEVIAFLKMVEAKLGPPSSPLTMADFERIGRESERLRKEHEDIEKAVRSFNRVFHELEISLSALFYSVLNIENSQIAYAVYFSNPGFESRIKCLNNAVLQRLEENDSIKGISSTWTAFFNLLSGPQRVRNTIAHGSALTINVNGKGHARFAPPGFDVNTFGRKLSSGQIPGLTASSIRQSMEAAVFCGAAADDFNNMFQATFNGSPKLALRIQQLVERVETYRQQAGNKP